jgi:hypothetical protein
VRVRQINTWRKSATVTDFVTDMRTANSLLGLRMGMFPRGDTKAKTLTAEHIDVNAVRQLIEV